MRFCALKFTCKIKFELHASYVYTTIKYDKALKASKENIDLVNKAESVCYEADKQVEMFTDTITDTEKTEIQTLATNIRENIQAENLTELETQVTELKQVMSTMLQNQNVVNDLNDI